MSKTITDPHPRISVEVASTDGISERWRRQYRDADGRWRSVASGDSGAIYDKIVAAGDDAAAVDAAIGNKSWTRVSCDCCLEYADIGARIGEYESKVYCLPCLEAAVKRVRAYGGAAP